MQFFVADYLSDTAYLDVVESGAYLHLLFNYWQTGKPLPNDNKKLAIISKCTEEQWLNVRSTVVGYFVEQDGVLVHDRVERDLQWVHNKTAKASIAGKASGVARAKKKRSESNPTQSQQKANECPTNVAGVFERKSNHTYTYTYTDTEKEAEQEIPVGTTSENIWERWIAIDTDFDEKNSRSFLGKQIRDYGEPHVITCLSLLLSTNKPIADPRSYFVGILKKTPLKDNGIDC